MKEKNTSMQIPISVSVVRASCSTLTLYVALKMDQPLKQNLKHLNLTSHKITF